jgi:hypothetical protein
MRTIFIGKIRVFDPCNSPAAKTCLTVELLNLILTIGLKVQLKSAITFNVKTESVIL